MSAETASGPTQDQVEILEYNFNKVNRHPDPTTLLLIAAEAGLSEEETQVRPPVRPDPCPGGTPSPGLRATPANMRVPLALTALRDPSPLLHALRDPVPRSPDSASLRPPHPTTPAPWRPP